MFVLGMPDVSMLAARNFFAQFGRVRKLDMGHQYCCVDYDTEADQAVALTRLEGYMYEGQHVLHAERAQSREHLGRSSQFGSAAGLYGGGTGLPAPLLVPPVTNGAPTATMSATSSAPVSALSSAYDAFVMGGGTAGIMDPSNPYASLAAVVACGGGSTSAVPAVASAPAAPAAPASSTVAPAKSAQSLTGSSASTLESLNPYASVAMGSVGSSSATGLLPIPNGAGGPPVPPGLPVARSAVSAGPALGAGLASTGSGSGLAGGVASGGSRWDRRAHEALLGMPLPTSIADAYAVATGSAPPPALPAPDPVAIVAAQAAAQKQFLSSAVAPAQPSGPVSAPQLCTPGQGAAVATAAVASAGTILSGGAGGGCSASGCGVGVSAAAVAGAGTGSASGSAGYVRQR